MFMKKFMIILLTLNLLFGLVGCNSINLESGYYYVGGEYEEFATPYVKLNFDDNSFSFGEGTLLSYAERGSFEIKGERITASTQNTTFVFEIKDSSSIILIDCGGYKPFAEYEGSDFTYRENI